jgi:hypothetical protein
MLSPLPRCSRRAQASLRLAHPYQPSPYGLTGRPAHRHFRGLLSVHSRYGLYARTITYVTVIRGLQTFRHLHACPGCFRLEHHRVGLSPTRKCRLCTAHTLLCRSKASFRSPGPEGQVFDLLTSKLALGSLADHRLIFDDRASVGFDRMTEMALFEGLVVVRPDSVEASLG